MNQIESKSEKPARYSEFAAAIRAAGLYTNGIEELDDCWDRVTVCSEGTNGVLGGNSFWVTELSDGWYLGTWGGMIYRIPQSNRAAEFCITCVRAEPRLKSDFSAEIKATFGLQPVSDEEFDHSTGSRRPEIEAHAIAEVSAQIGIEADQLTTEASWKGDDWEVRVWKLPATGVFDYSLTISRDSKSVKWNTDSA